VSLFATLKCTRALSKLHVNSSSAHRVLPLLRTAFPPFAFFNSFTRDFAQRHVYAGGS
jgi:hypothetical protein